MKPFPIRIDDKLLASVRAYARREKLSDAEAVRRLVDEGLRAVSGPDPVVEAIGQLRLDLSDQADHFDALDRRIGANEEADLSDSQNIAECLAGIRMIVQRIKATPAAPPHVVAPRFEKVDPVREEKSESKGFFGWGRSDR